MGNITNLKIFETNMANGPMKFKEFYDEYKDVYEEEMQFSNNREELRFLKSKFLENRIIVGEEYGFDGRKIVVPFDNERNYDLGSYFVADEKIYDKRDDLMQVKIPGDIVLLKKDNPGIVIAYPVSDEPVLIVEDQENGAAALAHCNLEKISKKVPVFLIDALKKEVGSSVSNLKVYIGTHLKKDHNYYLFKRKLIQDNPGIWKGCISRRVSKKKRAKRKVLDTVINNLQYKVDMEKAIKNMLIKEGIDKENIVVSDIDTYSSCLHYSDRFASFHKESTLQGKFLVGAYYDDTFPEYEKSSKVRSL